MQCPTLPELPPPPRGKTGWPWTIESKRLPEKMPDGRPWPRISIVTPSYNQGRYIEETIRSVLLQGYPDLEYIIMDGGSTDGAVDVIRKYEHWLTHWQSRPDSGQGAAILGGMKCSSGRIVHWINSDDVVLSDILGLIAMQSDAGNTAVASGIIEFGNGRRQMRISQNLTFSGFFGVGSNCIYLQPGVWMVRDCWAESRAFENGMQYAFDCLFMLDNLRKGIAINYLERPTVLFRHHKASKTVAQVDEFAREFDMIARLLLSETNEFSQHIAIKNWFRRKAYFRYISARLNDGPVKTLAVVISFLREYPDLSSARFALGALRRSLLVWLQGR